MIKPKYYERRKSWLISLNDRGEVLYDDDNVLVEFDSELEAELFIQQAKTKLLANKLLET